MHNKMINYLLVSLALIMGIFSIENVFAEETTLFEGVGHYAIATAGNNNSNRGTTLEANDYSLILDYPSNWDTIKQNISESIISRISNISGSYLNFDGTQLKTYLNSIVTCNLAFVPVCLDAYDFLVIAPDGTYEIVNVPYSKISDTYEISNKGSGWYYVSILDAPVMPQNGWSITTIYESQNVSINYLKIIKSGVFLSNEESTVYPRSHEIYFNSSLILKNNFQLYGIILAGGSNGFSIYDKENYHNTTEDKVWAILSDGTYQQLYEGTYNGRTVFQGRTSIDFATDTFNTVRSHNIQGGELDIFNETLSSDYFGGKEIVGYKIQKDGTDVIYLALIGLSQEIESPDINITADITRNSDGTIYNEVTLTNNSEYNSCSTTITIPIDSNLTNIRNVVMSPNNVATYKIEDNTITINFNSQFKAHDNFEVTYLADEVVPNKEQLDLDPVGSAYPADGLLCPSEILANKNLQIKVTAHDDIKMVEVIVPDTGTFISIITIIIGTSIIGLGYLVLLKNKKVTR